MAYSFTVRPNAGVEAAYRKRLDKELREMQDSLTYWLTAKYKQNEDIITVDSPASDLQAQMAALGRQWMKKFDKLAPWLARQFAVASADRSNRSMAAGLRRGGMTVRVSFTERQRDALQAVINENVALIKSIASQHLTQIEGIVMRSVTTGRDLSTMSDALQEQYGVSKRRAAAISLDQNNKCTSAMVAIKQQELGLQAMWLHSAGGKTPRPSHVKFSGKTYDPKVGALIEGERIWPGEKINCRCVSKTVVPGLT